MFMEGVLLEKCRENMRDNAGKLSVHLYEALKKGLYKPAAFFKGILFPLCEVSFHISAASVSAAIVSISGKQVKDDPDGTASMLAQGGGHRGFCPV